MLLTKLRSPTKSSMCFVRFCCDTFCFIACMIFKKFQKRSEMRRKSRSCPTPMGSYVLSTMWPSKNVKGWLNNRSVATHHTLNLVVSKADDSSLQILLRCLWLSQMQRRRIPCLTRSITSYHLYSSRLAVNLSFNVSKVPWRAPTTCTRALRSSPKLLSHAALQCSGIGHVIFPS